jgi:hypothetical protein
MENKLEEWTRRFKNKRVIITVGEHQGKTGCFKKVTGYNNSRGAIVSIKLVNVSEVKMFTADSFEFVNNLVQEEWDKDD